MSDAGVLTENFVLEPGNARIAEDDINYSDDSTLDQPHVIECCSSEVIDTHNHAQEVILNEFQSKNDLNLLVQNGLSVEDLKEPEEPDHDHHCPPLDGEIKETPACTNKNDENKWTYILGHDQLKKRVLKKGNEDGFRPIKGQLVEVRCVGKLDDNTKVDEFENLQLTLGEEEFLLAFDLCIPLMCIGETCELVSESRFAYGKSGRVPDIPPDSRITYEVELLSAKDQLPYLEFPIQERIQLGDKKRERGNALYDKGEYNRSIDEYTRALKVLEGENEMKKEDLEDLETLVEMRVKCYCNMAAAQMKIEAWDAANTSCDKVLKIQPQNVKALFRKGKCLDSMGDTKAALSLMREAAKSSPNSKAIQREIMSFEKKDRVENEAEKALYKKMLGMDMLKEKTNKSSDWWKWYLAGAMVVALLSIGLVSCRYSSE